MITLGKFTILDFVEFSNWLIPFSATRAIRLIQNHHTYIPSYKDFNGSNYIERLQAMEEAHLERGFSEIAQNLTTFPDGKIALCRSIDKIPAGIKGANTFGICIENLGNFDAGQDAMTAAHKDTIVKLNALLCRKFQLTPDTNSIVYHHWYDLDTGLRTDGTGNTKSCPGTNFFGGNTVPNCQANFIPLVVAALNDPVAIPLLAITGRSILQGKVTTLLNVRQDNNISSPIVKVLQQGTRVNVYEEKAGWYRVAPDAQWVKKEYVI